MDTPQKKCTFNNNLLKQFKDLELNIRMDRSNHRLDQIFRNHRSILHKLVLRSRIHLRKVHDRILEQLE